MNRAACAPHPRCAPLRTHADPSLEPGRTSSMIETRDVRVDYDDVTAVRDLNLQIETGEIFGLIGPNGAGKTSTIRVLATLQVPTHGDVLIGGVDVAESPGDVRRILGYMPDMPPVYKNLRCWEFLDLFAGAYFYDRRSRRARIAECLEQVNLTAKRRAFAGTLSRGMKQRLVLAKTMLPDPQVLLLDEPASGLDPIARIEMRDVLVELARRGRTVLISSHILTELSEFCSSIGIMERGRLVVSGRIDDIIQDLGDERTLRVELLEAAAAHEQALAGSPGVRSYVATDHQFEITFEGDDAEMAGLLQSLVARGVPVRTFTEHRMDVEDIVVRIGAKEVS